MVRQVASMRREMHTEFFPENLADRELMGVCVNRMTVLKQILEK
jgi:hypothetical protein